MIQGGQLVPLRVRDGDGGHSRYDLLFFVRLLRRVCVDAWDLPAGHARGEKEEKEEGGKEKAFKKRS